MNKKQQTQTAERMEEVHAPITQQAPTSNAVALAQAFTPPELLQLAIIKKSDIQVIERMAALAERWQEAHEKREARKAFINAMVDAKLEMPTIAKNRHVGFKARNPGASDTDYWHEDLAAVVETAQPVLARHGLEFRWRLQQPAPGMVTVTCMLSHRSGHTEENEITAAVDTSGNKNHIQAIKSAATYLERITALASVGLAARGQDDDGRAGGINQEPVNVITADQATAIRLLLPNAHRTEAQFCKWASIEAIEQLGVEFYDDSIATLERLAKEAGNG